jgi:predicted trehalose synthase
MIIEQIVEIPADRRVRLDFTVPESVSALGRQRIIIEFPDAESEVTAEEMDTIRFEEKRIKELNKKYPVHVCHTIEEAESAMAGQNTPEEREQFRQMLKRTHGALKDSKVWGQGVDVEAKIRAMRDEWGNND